MTQRAAQATRGSKWIDGNKLRDARRNARLTQRQLAELIGVSQQTIGHLEAGDDGYGDLGTTRQLAGALKTGPTDLMHAAGRREFAKLADANAT